MQFDPRQVSGPPPPVQPTGFFTGVKIRPIIIGVVVDYIATYAGMYGYFFVYLAQELAKRGEVSSDAVAAYMSTSEGLLISFAIGTLGTAIGGFVAGFKAGSFQSKHGAFVGVGSLIVAFLEQVASEQLLPVPEWYRALSVLAIIPAGAVGGYVAELFQSARPPLIRDERRPGT